MAHDAEEDGGLDAAFVCWCETLSQIEVNSERLLDLYLDGTLEECRHEERTKGLEAQEKEARAELEQPTARKQMIEAAERDIESYSAAIPEELERLEPE